MPIFQKSVVKKYLNDLNKEKLQIAWQQFQHHFHNVTIQQNILNAKEEEYQEGFVRDLFVQILGYTLKPQPGYNLVMEQKSTSDATKSDGAILTAEGAVVAVIELKDTGTTNLDKTEKQAFGYKHQHKDCRYVITSNFEQLRFYINDAVEYEAFNLFTLTKDSFSLLYCCLQQFALYNDVPLKMKQQSLAAEENITKKLYADYSRFKKRLFANITEQNPQYNQLELFKKTQKLLDRLLFIFFAEDRLLLPPNSIRQILQEWDQLNDLDQYVPLYDRFKKYFGYMNTGYTGKQYEIFAYNGGLFAPDEILDNITIEDQLLYDSCRGLSNYDFESEVDVNILGHIFEHSLGEIEEVERELQTPGIEAKKRQAKLSKRKKDGVFYTPRYITKYIVENTVGVLCLQKKAELNIVDDEFTPQKRKANTKQLLEKLEVYRQWLLKLTICDPACGSGAFLNQALEFLITEHQSIDALTSKLFGAPMILSDIESSILENNLYGVDINDEATEIAKLSLWLRTARKGRKLNSLNQHIKCGNSLIEDPEVAGDNAFNWQQEFPEVLNKGGFDVVIGNPPYGILINEKEQKYYNEKFPLANYKINLYVLFIERMFQIFDETKISFIIPKSLLFNSFYSLLRNYLLINAELIEMFSISEKVFEEAEVGGSLIITFNIKAGEKFQTNHFRLISAESFYNYPEGSIISILTQGYFLNIPNKEISIVSSGLISVKNKILAFHMLSEYYTLKNGLNPGNIKHILIGSQKKSEKHKEIIWGRDLNKYIVEWSGDYINYDKQIENSLTFADIKSKDGMNSQNKIDFALRTEDMFETLKLVVRKTGDRLICSIDENNYYFDTLIHGIYKKTDLYSLKYLLAILNSNAATFFYRLLHDIRGKAFAKISLDNLASFPIPEPTFETSAIFEKKADVMLSKSKEFQQIKQQLLQLLQAKYENIVLSKKLKDWPNLYLKEFLKELEKQKIKLTLPEQAEWMVYFEAEKIKASSIQQLIIQTGKEIDKMVYILYGLTDEEQKIVEAG